MGIYDGDYMWVGLAAGRSAPVWRGFGFIREDAMRSARDSPTEYPVSEVVPIGHGGVFSERDRRRPGFDHALEALRPVFELLDGVAGKKALEKLTLSILLDSMDMAYMDGAEEAIELGEMDAESKHSLLSRIEGIRSKKP